MLQRLHVGQNRVSGDRFMGRHIARESRERRRYAIHSCKEIDGLALARTDVQVKLIDRLKVWNLEEKRLTVGQYMGRADRHGVVARLTGMSNGQLRRAVAGTVVIIPCLGEMPIRLAGEFTGQRSRKLEFNPVFVARTIAWATEPARRCTLTR